MTDSAPVRLRITEIFFSIQGESSLAGLPTVFVRLTGCPLRCVYCDTEYAFQGGQWMELDAVLSEIARYPATHVTVTGGEPLAQPACHELLRSLCDCGYKVSLETSGALDVSQVDRRVIKVLDLKTPASGESSRNLYENLDHLLDHDEVKFVIANREDYEWSRQVLEKYQLNEKCTVLFSAVHGQMNARELAEWILADGLPVRFQMQLHKLLWGQEPGH